MLTDAIASNMRNKMRTHMGANGSPLFTRGEKKKGKVKELEWQREREKEKNTRKESVGKKGNIFK